MIFEEVEKRTGRAIIVVRSIGRKKQVRLGGGTGRRTGLKIRWTARFVGVQFPLQALQ